MRKLLLLMFALLTSVSGAWAQRVPFTVSYELTSSGRNYSKYYSDNSTNTNNWCNRWEVRGDRNLTSFPENLPGVFVSADDYCISAWDSKLRNGDNATNTFTIHAIGTGIVTGYTLTATVTDNRTDKTEDFTKTITPSAGGSAVTWTTSDNTSKTVTVTGLSSNTASFTLTGTHHGEVRVQPTNFQMTVEFNLVTSTSGTSYDKYYYLACPRGGLSTNDGKLASTYKNDSYTMKPFAFVESGGNYYLYSIADNKYVSESGALEDTPTAAVEIGTNGKTSDNYPAYVKIGSKYLRTSDYQTSYGANTGGLGRGDAGNYYAIIEGGSLKQLLKDGIDAVNGLCGINATTVKANIDAATSTADILSAYHTPINTAESKFFTMKNYNNSPSKYLYVTSANVTTSSDPELVQFRFMLDGGVAILGSSNQKYVGPTSQSSQATAVTSPVEYYVESDATKGFAFKCGGGNYRAYLHCDGSNNVVGWSTDADHTWWAVEEVSAAVTYIVKKDNVEIYREQLAANIGDVITALPSSAQRAFTNYSYPVASLTTVAGENEFVANATYSLPFTASTDYANATWYYLKIRTSKYVVYGDTAPYELTTTKNSTSKGMWAFIGDPYTGIRVINRAAGDGKYLQATGTQPSMTTTPTYWTIGENDGNFTLYSGANNYMNDAANANYLKYWNSTSGASDDGSTFRVEAVSANANTLTNLLDVLKAVNWSDTRKAGQLNRYNVTGQLKGYAGNERELISSLDSEDGYADANIVEAINTIQGWNTSYALNMPPAGFYRLKGNTSGKYLAAGMANNKFAMSDATDATTIFYFDGEKLTNYSSGMCNGMTKDAWAWVKGNAASTVEFQDGLTNGGYAIKSATCNFYDNYDKGANADRGDNLTINSSTDGRYTNWYLTEIKYLPVAISSVGYATLYAPVALTIPSGVTAYIATVDDKTEYLSLVEVEGGIIPANTGVILAGDEGSYDFVITTGGNVDNNVLRGTAVAIARPDSYILATGSNGIGFYKDGAETIPGFKAYLPASAVSNARGFLGFNFDDPTAISVIEAAMNAGKVIYDLSGRRVENPVSGLYIVNGKKVFINKK